MVPALINDFYVIRFCVCAQNASDDDIDFAWNVIASTATDVMEACDGGKKDEVIKVNRVSTSNKPLKIFTWLVTFTQLIEKFDSLDVSRSGSESGSSGSDLEQEKLDVEENENDDVFLFDINIPSVPSFTHGMYYKRPIFHSRVTLADVFVTSQVLRKATHRRVDATGFCA